MKTTIVQKTDYTLEEANKIIDEINSKPATVFCPLLKDTCRKACVCYAIARIRDSHQGYIEKMGVEYKIQGGYCDNAMFWGQE